MKISNIKYMAIAALTAFGATSCDDFLDRPAEDSYNVDNYYANDEQCDAGVFYLYNSPWSDFTRGGIIMTETMVGNIYQSQSPYLDFSVNGSDNDLVFMYESLWQVNAHCNTVYNNLKTANCSEATRAKCMGECLTLKAMAYFYLARTFGAVPIIHDNSKELEEGTYNDKKKVMLADVYEYIVMTLEKAMELFRDEDGRIMKGDAGRIDYYAAEGLLAKVYLTKSGVNQSGTRDEAALNMAKTLAEDVIDNSGRQLMDNYADIFRLQNNNCEESLIGWRWDAASGQYTAQNTLQSDLAMVGFDEFGDNWGGYNGPSIDLQLAFGVTPDQDPKDRDKSVIDTRRKATMMMAGDKYEYFWQDKGGFDYINFIYDKDGYGKGGPGELQSPTGANEVKHLYGNANDHMKGLGVSASSMSSSLSTHLLRLADVYLIYVEAVIGNQGSTTDEKARNVFWQVRNRAISEYKLPASVSWEDVWKERRLELACEGDRWYDFVRLSYYDPQKAINELVNQKRDVYDNLNNLYKAYYESGQTVWNATADQHYTSNPKIPNVTKECFTLPFPSEDVVFNPNLMEDPVHVDVRSEYSY